MCPSCARVARSLALCAKCRATLVPAPDRVVGGLLVRTGYVHEGAARRLVHRIKYQGLAAAVLPLAERLVQLIHAKGDRPTALVPIPRARVRRGLHGIDPAVVLATELGAALDVPVVDAIRPGWWWPQHAKRGRHRRPPHLQASGARTPIGSALIDDVITTGTTLDHARHLVRGARYGYAATSGGGPAPSVSNGSSDPSRARPRE